jgi:hypothetical protein
VNREPWRITIEVSPIPKLENRVSRASRFAETTRRRNARQKVVAAIGFRGPPRPLDQARVVVEWHSKNEPDPHNTDHALKPVFDALTPARSYRQKGGRLVNVYGAGVLKDDRSRNFEGGRAVVNWFPVSRRRKPPRGIEKLVIHIEEVLPPESGPEA